MEDILELVVVLLIFVFGAVKKSQKKQKKKAAGKPKAKPARQAAMAQTAPAQPVEPVVMPPESLAAPTAPQQDFESAFTALSELLDLDESLPASAKSSGSPTHEMTSIEAETAMKQRAELIQSRVEESLFGESTIDGHGCIGGSMPDHNAEGETLAEHSRHEHSRAERLQAESAAIRAERLRKPSAAEMRKAVVMSEILDKPVSLRRRSI